MRKGFTLIELLVVIAIIGLLASVVLIGLGPSQRSGRDARRVADLRQVQTALELHFQSNGSYPADDGVTFGTGSVAGQKLPNDPNSDSGKVYYYKLGTGSNTYTLGAQLEDASNKIMSSSIVDTSVSFNSTTCGLTGMFCVGIR